MSRLALGRAFAMASSDEQAEFLNEAGRMLRRATAGEHLVMGFEMQCAFIVDALDDDGRRLVLKIAEMINSDWPSSSSPGKKVD